MIINDLIENKALVITLIIVIVGIIIAINIKSIIKTLVTVLLLAVVGFLVYNILPTDIQDSAKIITENFNKYKDIADTSDNIKYDLEKKEIQVKLNNTWYSTKDIEQYAKSLDGKNVKVTIAGQTVEVDDEKVKELLKEIEKQSK